MGMISFFEYTEKGGIWCTHSFFVPNPVLFKMNGKSTSETCLYKGRNGEIFFFNMNEITTSTGVNNETSFDLQLQIIQDVHEKTALYECIMKGKVQIKEYKDVYTLNAVPTLIQEGELKMIVFAHCSPSSEGFLAVGGPSLYFYNIAEAKETARICGGEAFIDYFSNPNDPGLGQVVFLANKELMAEPIWKGKLENEQCELFMNSAAVARKTAIVVTMNVNLTEQDFTEIMPINSNFGLVDHHQFKPEDLTYSK
jgi:hypothetical protein